MRTKKTTKRNRQRSGKSIAEIVERYGTVAQFARDLSKLSGEEVKWERVYNWRLRNSVSKSMVLYVHQLTGAPLTDLLR